ncbi:MAG: hypothetical protein ACTHMQ_04530 [Protaetiibacter sp.]
MPTLDHAPVVDDPATHLDAWFARLAADAGRGSARPESVLVRRMRTLRRLVRELGVRTTVEVVVGELRKALR